MLRTITAIALLTGALAGCGSDNPTAGPEEQATVAELDTAVRAAAQKLLDKESVPIAVIYFGFDDTEKIIRYDWIDYRPDNGVLAIYKSLDSESTVGLSLSEGRWATAQVSSAGETTVWQEEPDLGAIEVIPAVQQVIEMTTRVTPEFSEADTALVSEVTRQGASDGSELWTLAVPEDAGSGVITAQWLVSPSGILNFYRFYSDSAPLAAGAGTIIYEFGVNDEDPDELIVPDVGSPLLLDDLGIPIALRNLEE